MFVQRDEQMNSSIHSTIIARHYLRRLLKAMESTLPNNASGVIMFQLEEQTLILLKPGYSTWKNRDKTELLTIEKITKRIVESNEYKNKLYRTN